MKDLIKKSFLLGLGAASLTKKQAEKVVNELVKRNAVTIREGRDLLKKVQKAAKQEQKRIGKFASQEARRLVRSLGAVPKSQIEGARKSLQAINKELSSRGKKALKDALKKLSE